MLTEVSLNRQSTAILSVTIKCKRLAYKAMAINLKSVVGTAIAVVEGLLSRHFGAITQ